MPRWNLKKTGRSLSLSPSKKSKAKRRASSASSHPPESDMPHPLGKLHLPDGRPLRQPTHQPPQAEDQQPTEGTSALKAALTCESVFDGLESGSKNEMSPIRSPNSTQNTSKDQNIFDLHSIIQNLNGDASMTFAPKFIGHSVFSGSESEKTPRIQNTFDDENSIANTENDLWKQFGRSDNKAAVPPHDMSLDSDVKSIDKYLGDYPTTPNGSIVGMSGPLKNMHTAKNIQTMRQQKFPLDVKSVLQLGAQSRLGDNIRDVGDMALMDSLHYIDENNPDTLLGSRSQRKSEGTFSISERSRTSSKRNKEQYSSSHSSGTGDLYEESSQTMESSSIQSSSQEFQSVGSLLSNNFSPPQRDRDRQNTFSKQARNQNTSNPSAEDNYRLMKNGSYTSRTTAASYNSGMTGRSYHPPAYSSSRNKNTQQNNISMKGTVMSDEGSFSTADTPDTRTTATSIVTTATSIEQEYFDAVYVQQKYAYFSIGISILQLIVMTVMMALCGMAPLEINPMVGPYPDTLSYWGGKNAYLIVEGMEIWRFLSPIMLHAGVIHLFCNVAVQLETAAFFEREWGSVTWFTIYLSSSVGSILSSCILNPNTISVGGSGALMGLFGAKLSEVIFFGCCCDAPPIHRRKRTGDYDDVHRNVQLEQLGGVTCSVAIVSLFCFIPYVDWGGHLGGLLTGFAAGMVLFSEKIDNLCKRVIWLLLGFGLVVGGIWSGMWYLYSAVETNEELGDACEYYSAIYNDGYDCTCQIN